MFEQRDGNDKTSLQTWLKRGSLAVLVLAVAGLGFLAAGNKLNERNTSTDTEIELQADTSGTGTNEVDALDVELLMDNGINRAGDTSDFTDDSTRLTVDNAPRAFEATEEVAETEATTEAEVTTEATTAATTEATTATTTTAATTTVTTTATTTVATTQATTAAPTTTQQKTVTVGKGEGWWHIGNRTGVDYRYIAVYNGKVWTDQLYQGNTLKIPTAAEIADITLPTVTQATTAAPTQTTTTAAATQATTQAASTGSPKQYTLSQFMRIGRLNWQGKQFTYYSQRVLPGGGLRIPGRHVNADGYVSDGDGYIVLASDYYAKGTVISTPFGYYGKVYDAFGTGQGSHRFDVYIR